MLTQRRCPSCNPGCTRSAQQQLSCMCCLFFFFQAEDGIRDLTVTGVQTCALPICAWASWSKQRRPGEAGTLFLGEPLAGIGVCAAHRGGACSAWPTLSFPEAKSCRSEEHTSELQSQSNLVCRLLLEKKKKIRPHHALSSNLHLVNTILGCSDHFFVIFPL